MLDGADYIGVGPIFRSSTKPRDWEKVAGLEYARQVSAEIKLPAVGNRRHQRGQCRPSVGYRHSHYRGYCGDHRLRRCRIRREKIEG